MRLNCAQNLPHRGKFYICEAMCMFTRKGYATSVSGKTANGCPVRSAEPPDNMDFHVISQCGAKLCKALKKERVILPGKTPFFPEREAV